MRELNVVLVEWHDHVVLSSTQTSLVTLIAKHARLHPPAKCGAVRSNASRWAPLPTPPKLHCMLCGAMRWMHFVASGVHVNVHVCVCAFCKGKSSRFGKFSSPLPSSSTRRPLSASHVAWRWLHNVCAQTRLGNMRCIWNETFAYARTGARVRPADVLCCVNAQIMMMMFPNDHCYHLKFDMCVRACVRDVRSACDTHSDELLFQTITHRRERRETS